MLEVDRGERRPGFLERTEEHLQNDFDDPGFGGGEQSAWGQLSNAAAEASKETVQGAEDHGGLNDDHGIAAQGAHSHDVDRQGGLEVSEVVTKAHDLCARGVHAWAGAQYLEHTQSKQPDEPLIDHVQ